MIYQKEREPGAGGSPEKKESGKGSNQGNKGDKTVKSDVKRP